MYDLISRLAVKEKLKQNLTYMRAFGVDRCLELIDEIPAVQPTTIIPKISEIQINNTDENFRYAPQHEPIYLIDSGHNIYIGTAYQKDGTWYRGNCIKGDADSFYRLAIVDWAYIKALSPAQPEQCEWIPKEVEGVPYGLIVECSKCKHSELIENALYHKYCPNCGRKVIREYE